MSEAVRTRIAKLKELATTNRAWIRTSDDVVTNEGARVSPYPDLVEILVLAESALSAQGEGTKESLLRLLQEVWDRRENYVKRVGLLPR